MREYNVSHSRHDTAGFSLLELVVAVSIMLILGVVGFVAYQNYTDNARQAAVESAANQVLTAVIAEDNVPDGDVIAQVEHFNESSDGIVTDIVSANQYGMIVEATTCDGDVGRAKVPGDHSHVDITSYSNVSYEWLGTPGSSASVKMVCDEVAETNLTPYGIYSNSISWEWISNNTDLINESTVLIDDHPQGITTAREKSLKPEAYSRRDFYSDHKVAGLKDIDYDYFGAWVWSSVDADLELNVRTFEEENIQHLPAKTWTFVVSEKGDLPGVHMYVKNHSADRSEAYGRVTGVIATNDEPPTEYFDGNGARGFYHE